MRAVPSPPSLVRRLERHRTLVTALLSALVLAVFHGRTLFAHVRLASSDWAFADDVRVLIHPLFRHEDAALFPDDPVVDYYLASLPDGYHLLYRLLGPVVGVVTLSKVLPYLLFAVTLLCLGVAARKLGGAAAMFGTLSLSLGSAYVLGRMSGGLPRGFAMPLVAAGALFLTYGRARALSALTVLAAGLYPVVALLLGAALTFLLALPSPQRGCTAGWSWKKRLLLLGGAGLLSGLVLLPSMLRFSAYGPALSPADSSRFPEAGELGRFQPADRPPFPALPMAAKDPLSAALLGAETPLVPFTDLRSQASWLLPLLVLLAAGGWAYQARRRPEALRLALLPAAVLVCHTLSLLLEPRLFLPERHVAYGVPVVALLGVPAAFGMFVDARRRWARALPVAWVALVLSLIGARGSAWTGITVRVSEEARPLYAAVAALPPAAVVAGWPDETNDSVPYLSRRSVLVARETHMPFHLHFTELMRKRTRALIAALYATDPTPIKTLRDRHGVTHLLLDRRLLAAPPLYFEPFETEARASFEAGRATGFALARIPPAAVVATFGDTYQLVQLSRF
jgi:MFS family permease